MFSFEIYETGDPGDSSVLAVAPGVFVEQQDMHGIDLAELADTEDLQLKEEKILFSLINTINGEGDLANLTELGFNITEGTATGVAARISNTQYTINLSYYSDLENKTTLVLPLPTIGNQVGLGDGIITNYFPNAVKLTSGDPIPSAGVLIPTSLVASYSGVIEANIDVGADSRDWLSGLLLYMADTVKVRSATYASSIVSKNINNLTASTLPTNALDATNPTTGIDSSKINRLGFFTKDITIQIQTERNQETQKFDVRLATT